MEETPEPKCCSVDLKRCTPKRCMKTDCQPLAAPRGFSLAYPCWKWLWRVAQRDFAGCWHSTLAGENAPTAKTVLSVNWFLSSVKWFSVDYSELTKVQNVRHEAFIVHLAHQVSAREPCQGAPQSSLSSHEKESVQWGNTACGASRLKNLFWRVHIWGKRETNSLCF